MSQRYFLIAETTYEVLRLNVNAALGYPNQSGLSFLQNPLKAPRDAYRRVLLALDLDIPGATTALSALTTLLQNQLAEELDEATYLNAIANSNAGGGVSSWNDLTDKPSTFAPAAHKASHATGGSDALTPADIGAAATSHTHTASAITDFATAVAAAAPAYLLPDATASTKGGVIVGAGIAVSGGTISVVTYSVRSDTVGSVSYIGRATSGTATSSATWTIRRTTVAAAGTVTVATATATAWDNRLTASYS